MTLLRSFFISLVASALISCSSVPSFDHPLGSTAAPPTVADLVTHIQCEIWDVMAGEGGFAHASLSELSSRKYIAYATLTVDVTNLEGTAPSLSFISPFAAPMTNLTSSIGGQYSATQHRNMTETFTIDVSKFDETAPAKCHAHSGAGKGLRGNLGLESVIATGLKHVTDDEFIFKKPTSETKPSFNAIVAPVFGSTVDFTIVYGISNVGPTWTLTKFKGPGGGSGGAGGGGATQGASGSGGGGGGGSSGLLTLTRTERDTLVISFAPQCPDDGECPPPIKKKADADLGYIDVTPAVLQANLNSLSMPAGLSTAERSSYLLAQTVASSNRVLAQFAVDLREQLRAQADAVEANATKAPSASESAVKAAQDNNTRMILQNILNSP